jgi:hypothetical protein
MHKENKLSPAVLTPKALSRLFFYILISPMIYEESGIVTTILLGLLSTEIAIKGDWLLHTNTLISEMQRVILDMVDFQNGFIKSCIKRNKNASKN